MAYAKGSVIGQNDVHFYTVRVNNNLLGTGSADYGYGQSILPTNTPGFPVITSETLLRTERAIENLLNHQGNSTYSMMYPYTKGMKIDYDPRLPENYQKALDGRLNAASISGGNDFNPGAASAGISTSSQVTFNNDQTITIRAKFASHDRARYFFNAGGIFRLDMSQPSAPLAEVGVNLGRLIFGSGTRISQGTSYTGLTRLDIHNRGSGNAIVFTNRGFYGIGSGGVTASNILAYAYNGTAGIEVYASYDGAGTITFTMLSFAWSGVKPASPPRIAIGSSFTVLAFPPSTRYLTDSWGVPEMTTTTTQTSVETEASELTIMSHWYANRSNYVRSGLSPTSYPNIPNATYGEYYQWNSPHFRFYNGYYTELFNYNTASTPRDYSGYFTVVTCVTGALGGGRIDTPTDLPFNSVSINTWGQLVSTQYKIYTGDYADRTQPNNQYNDGIAYRISVYQGFLADNNENYVSAPQSGQNAGSWTYQFMMPGQWGVAKEEVDFNTYASRTIGPGRMAVILSERGGNSGQLQYAATPYAINYDTWWYNGGDFQINPNPTSSPINVDLQNWNSSFTPRVYLELSKDGGAATPTTTSPPPAPTPPPFDPGFNPGYTEYF